MYLASTDEPKAHEMCMKDWPHFAHANENSTDNLLKNRLICVIQHVSSYIIFNILCLPVVQTIWEQPYDPFLC